MTAAQLLDRMIKLPARLDLGLQKDQGAAQASLLAVKAFVVFVLEVFAFELKACVVQIGCHSLSLWTARQYCRDLSEVKQCLSAREQVR